MTKKKKTKIYLYYTNTQLQVKSHTEHIVCAVEKLTVISPKTYLNVNMTTCFITTLHLYIYISYNWHNFYNESTFVTDSKHLHNVLDTPHPVQQCFKLKKKSNFIIYYVFFWVIPRRLNYICRRFGILYLFHLHRQVVWSVTGGENSRAIYTEKGWLGKSRSL